MLGPYLIAYGFRSNDLRLMWYQNIGLIFALFLLFDLIITVLIYNSIPCTLAWCLWIWWPPTFVRDY